MRTWVSRGFRVVAILAALTATVQPVLGSFALFRPTDAADYDTIHLAVGGILYNFTLLLVVLAPFTLFRRRWVLLGLGVALYALTHAQLLLGLEANDDPQLLAYHIPIGVLILLLSYAAVALGFGVRADPSAA